MRAAAVVAVLVVGGCSSGPSAPDPEPTCPDGGLCAGGTVTEQVDDEQLSWPDGSPVERTAVDTSAAWAAGDGVDYTVLYTSPPGSVDEAYLGALALAHDGTLVVGQVPGGQGDGEGWLRSSTVVGSYDGTAFDAFAPVASVGGDHPVQAFDAAVADGLVAWVETETTHVAVSSWRIVAAGADRAARVVAQSAEPDDGTRVIVGAPMIVGDRVYWATGTAAGVDVASRRADGTGATTAVVTGVGPALAADASGLYVVRSSGTGDQSIERVTPDRVSEVLVRRSGGQVARMVADDGVLAFVTGTRSSGAGRIEVVDTRTRTARTVPLDGQGRSTSLALCDGRLLWTEAGTEGLGDTVATFGLDVATGDLRRIDVADAFGSLWCNGDLLAWQHLGQAPGARASTVVARWTD